jgi:hypothetical protein
VEDDRLIKEVSLSRFIAAILKAIVVGNIPEGEALLTRVITLFTEDKATGTYEQD